MDPFKTYSESLARKTAEETVAAVERRLDALMTQPERDRPAVRWLTNKEAQETLGVSKATLARWRADKTLEFAKVGQSVYYSVDDVNALLESRRVRRAA